MNKVLTENELLGRGCDLGLQLVRAPHKFVLGVPYGGGANFSFETTRAIYHCSERHEGGILGAAGSWGNFNSLLATALNLAADGQVTHLAFLHADIAPQEKWVDVLFDEMDRLAADMVSVVVPIKDARGVSSSGIGDPNNRWHPLRRFTMQEIWQRLPETFNAADVAMAFDKPEYADYPLLHNDGCFLMDLRRPLFRTVDADGVLAASFDFPRRIRLGDDGRFTVEGESEDWYWSRKLHELGARTYITRKVVLTHEGPFSFPNTAPWGQFQDGDDDTRERWGTK